MTREQGNPFVIWGTKEGGHLRGIQRIWQRIRDDANLYDVRLHDLRHAFASVAAASGQSLYLIGKILGHRQASTTERYAHIGENPLQALAESTARQIHAAMTGKATTKKSKKTGAVIAFPKQQRKATQRKGRV